MSIVGHLWPGLGLELSSKDKGRPMASLDYPPL